MSSSSADHARHRDVVAATAATERTMRPQSVPVNAYETTGAVVVLAPLPAVTPDDVTVELDGSHLRFWAHLRSSGPREFLVHEWEYGGYERELDLPDGYAGGLEASLTNGQLAIRVLRGFGTGTRSITPTTSAPTLDLDPPL
jgi:HSP20 family molecular chaperone IbpA